MNEGCAYMWSVTDWRKDDIYKLLTAEQRGAYREILDECWVNFSVPNKPELLARIGEISATVFEEMWPLIKSKFREINGGQRLVSKRMEKDRDRLKRIRDANRARTEKATKTRIQKWRNIKEIATSRQRQGERNVLPDTDTEKNIHSSSPIDPSNTLDISLLKITLPSLEKRAPVVSRKRDDAMDCFSEKCKACTGVPYIIGKGDAVQLARLRQSFETPSCNEPPDWDHAVENYFASPLPKYSIADLAVRYSVFKNSPLNAFNKPTNHKGTHHETAAEGRQRRLEEQAKRDLAKGASGDANRISDGIKRS